MSKFLIGVDGVSREVNDMLIGVDGVARRVKSAYIGVDGQARLFFGGFYHPTVGEEVVSIGAGEVFSDATKFVPGRYEIQIAGSPGSGSGFNNTNYFTVTQTMRTGFHIFAITSTSATDSILTDLGFTSQEGTIFGGAGGKSSGCPSSIPSNPWRQGALSWGAACCHFIPVGGTFGTDYLRCFHCGAPASGMYGGGGAYGGGAGGRGSYTYVVSGGAAGRYVTGTGGTGASGAGGVGGTGGRGTISGNTGSGTDGNPGNSGTGAGAGTATSGGRAYYNGYNWIQPSITTTTISSAYVKVIYLGSV